MMNPDESILNSSGGENGGYYTGFPFLADLPDDSGEWSFLSQPGSNNNQSRRTSSLDGSNHSNNNSFKEGTSSSIMLSTVPEEAPRDPEEDLRVIQDVHDRMSVKLARSQDLPNSPFLPSQLHQVLTS